MGYLDQLLTEDWRNVIMKKRILFLILIAGVMCLSACRNRALEDANAAVDRYNKTLAEYNIRIASYNEAVSKIEEANQTIENAVDQAQAVIDKGEEPFDPETLTALKEAMAEADKSKASVPDRVPEYAGLKVDEEAKTEDLKELTERADEDRSAMESFVVPDVPQIPDVSGIVNKVDEERQAYADSIQGLKQITAPSDDFIKDRLQKIKNITAIQAVTEDHDPNGHLNKQGGYIGCTYYTDKRVERSDLYIEDGKDNPVDIGTEGGGAIEVYNTDEKGWIIEAEVYGNGVDMWLRSQGDYIELL